MATKKQIESAKKTSEDPENLEGNVASPARFSPATRKRPS